MGRFHAQSRYEFAQGLDRRSSGAEDPRRILGKGDHRGLDPHRRGPSGDDGLDRLAQLFQNRLVVGGRKFSKTIGAGRGDGHPRLPDQGQGYRVARHPHRHRGKAGGHDVRNDLPLGKNQGEGSRPKFLDQSAGKIWHLQPKPFRLLGIGHVDDDRIEMGPAFGLEDLGHRQGREGIGPQAIHGLGGEGHKPPGPDDLRGPLDPLRVRRENQSHAQS